MKTRDWRKFARIYRLQKTDAQEFFLYKSTKIKNLIVFKKNFV